MRRHFSMPRPRTPRPRSTTERLFGGFCAEHQVVADDRHPDRGGALREPRCGQVDLGGLRSRGATPPHGDIYAVPGLEAHPGGQVKRRAALNCASLRTTISGEGGPRGGVRKRRRLTRRTDFRSGGQLPGHGLPSSSGIPLFVGAWGGARDETMCRESQIMLAVLGEMMSRGIVGLSLHDGLLVQASKAEETKVIMMDVARSITSTDIPVGMSGGPL